MQFIKQYRKLLFYLLIIALIVLFQNNPVWIETIYIPWVYNPFSVFLRYITSVFSFSVGDVFYIVFGSWVLYKIVQQFRYLKQNLNGKQLFWIKTIYPLLCFFCKAFIVFKLFWGLNYSRQGVATQFNCKKEGYCKEQLNSFIDDLIEQVNYTRSLISDTSLPKIEVKTSIDLAIKEYEGISKEITFLKYLQPSVKPSLYSKLGNYVGFVGYFNPFSGEAQVRNDIPEILIPFIATHEIAHQLGYASESEASFIGYVVCNSSKNNYVKYSLQLELLALALSELPIKYLEDGCAEQIRPRFYQINDCLSKQVKTDRKLISLFFERNKTSLSEVSNNLYDSYLKLNSQYTGINSYNEVLDWVISFKN